MQVRLYTLLIPQLLKWRKNIIPGKSILVSLVFSIGLGYVHSITKNPLGATTDRETDSTLVGCLRVLVMQPKVAYWYITHSYGARNIL